MKVFLNEDLFFSAALATTPLLLPAIFQICSGRHKVNLNFDAVTSAAFLTWMNSRPLNEKDAINALFREALQSEAREIIDSVIVVGAGVSDWSVSPPIIGPTEILQLLQTPLIILVENAINDGAFLKAVGFGFDCDSFKMGIEQGYIRIDHSGGSTMSALIDQKKNDRIWAYRMWAIFDSDALTPNTPSSEALRKVASCSGARIRFHMLNRRAIENYLPHETLDSAIPHTPKNLPQRRTVGAFGRMSPGQRAHFNMKNGFNGDSARLGAGGPDHGHLPTVNAHFAGIVTRDRASLAAGFGGNIAQLFSPASGRFEISETHRRKDKQEAEMIPLFQRILRSL